MRSYPLQVGAVRPFLTVRGMLMNTSATALNTLSDPFATEQEWLEAHAKLSDTEQKPRIPNRRTGCFRYREPEPSAESSWSGLSIGIIFPILFEPFGEPWVLLHLLVSSIALLCFFEKQPTFWKSMCMGTFLMNAAYILLLKLC